MKRTSVLMKITTLAMAVAVVAASWPQSMFLGIGEPKLPTKFDQ